MSTKSELQIDAEENTSDNPIVKTKFVIVEETIGDSKPIDPLPKMTLIASDGSITPVMVEPFRDEDGKIGFAVVTVTGSKIIASEDEWDDWAVGDQEKVDFVSWLKTLGDKIYWEMKGVPLPARPFPKKDMIINLAQKVEDEIRNVVELTNEDHYKTQTAWVAATWLKDVLDYAPRNSIVGPTACGKSQMLSVLTAICYRGHDYTNPSLAPLFRDVENFAPTIIIDSWQKIQEARRLEIEATLYEKGFAKGGTVARVEGEFSVHRYKVYNWMAIASIKAPHIEDLANRSIVTPMATKARGSKLKKHPDEDVCAEIQGELLTLRMSVLSGEIDIEAVKKEAELLIESKAPDLNPRSCDMAQSLVTVCLLLDIDHMPILNHIKDSQDRAIIDLNDSFGAEVFHALQAVLENVKKIDASGNSIFPLASISTRDIAEQLNQDMNDSGNQRNTNIATKTVTRAISDLGFKLRKGPHNTTCFDPNGFWETYDRHEDKFGQRNP